jgi:hypothetical protein
MTDQMTTCQAIVTVAAAQAESDILSSLFKILNLINLKNISTLKLMNKNFHE